MTHPLGLKSWATGALMLAAMSACASDGLDPDLPAPPPENPSMTTTATPSSSSSSASDAATATATNLLARYFETVDQVRSDPAASVDKLKDVAIGIQLDAQSNLVRRERADGRRQVGTTSVAVSKVQSVSLDNTDPANGVVPTVVVDVCWDVSDVDIVDTTGKSVVTPARQDRGWTRYTVANYQWNDDPEGGWRVASGEDLEEEPCAP
ncbi:hypothetical protein KVF89_25245 [Nocardioides carbamazepini]|nr:hypothetical protein [Nocardioides carbamazepini]